MATRTGLQLKNKNMIESTLKNMTKRTIQFMEIAPMKSLHQRLMELIEEKEPLDNSKVETLSLLIEAYAMGLEDQRLINGV